MIIYERKMFAYSTMKKIFSENLLLFYQIFAPIRWNFQVWMGGTVLVEAIMRFNRNTTITVVTPNNVFGMTYTIMFNSWRTWFKFLVTIWNGTLCNLWKLPIFEQMRTEYFEAKHVIHFRYTITTCNIIIPISVFIDVLISSWILHSIEK